MKLLKYFLFISVLMSISCEYEQKYDDIQGKWVSYYNIDHKYSKLEYYFDFKNDSVTYFMARSINENRFGVAIMVGVQMTSKFKIRNNKIIIEDYTIVEDNPARRIKKYSAGDLKIISITSDSLNLEYNLIGEFENRVFKRAKYRQDIDLKKIQYFIGGGVPLPEVEVQSNGKIIYHYYGEYFKSDFSTAKFDNYQELFRYHDFNLSRERYLPKNDYGWGHCSGISFFYNDTVESYCFIDDYRPIDLIPIFDDFKKIVYLGRDTSNSIQIDTSFYFESLLTCQNSSEDTIRYLERIKNMNNNY